MVLSSFNKISFVLIPQIHLTCKLYKELYKKGIPS